MSIEEDILKDVEPKYKVGEVVKICSWTGETIQPIMAIGVAKYYRHDDMVITWGYKFAESTGLTFEYVPEGYLRKIIE